MKEISLRKNQESPLLNILTFFSAVSGIPITGVILDFMFNKFTLTMRAIEYFNSIRPQ